MKTSKTLMLAVLFAAPFAAFANPVKISNEDVSALFGALSQIKDGLSYANVQAASEDIWVLKATAEAFSQNQNHAARDLERASKEKDANPATDAVQKKWDDYRVSEVTLDLQPMTPLTEQEVKDSKITPALLAPIQHYLYPAKK